MHDRGSRALRGFDDVLHAADVHLPRKFAFRFNASTLVIAAQLMMTSGSARATRFFTSFFDVKSVLTYSAGSSTRTGPSSREESVMTAEVRAPESRPLSGRAAHCSPSQGHGAGSSESIFQSCRRIGLFVPVLDDDRRADVKPSMHRPFAGQRPGTRDHDRVFRDGKGNIPFLPVHSLADGIVDGRPAGKDHSGCDDRAPADDRSPRRFHNCRRSARRLR